mmetsp:Transcript_4040/g.11523  ORF Transcript_4040/g.11523 Transcript_4040/m.11523 type:complete len:200 (+) Transcript_4040:488-1087(+)
MVTGGLLPIVLLGIVLLIANTHITAAPISCPDPRASVPAIPSEATLCTGTSRMRSFSRWAKTRICGFTHPKHFLTFTPRRRSYWTSSRQFRTKRFTILRVKASTRGTSRDSPNTMSSLWMCARLLAMEIPMHPFIVVAGSEMCMPRQLGSFPNAMLRLKSARPTYLQKPNALRYLKIRHLFQTIRLRLLPASFPMAARS